MTDLENREAFLYELNGLGYSFKNTAWLTGIGGNNGMFEDDQLHMVWEVWNASAQREGFKLAPLEPSKEMLKSADNCGIDGKVTANIIYKAMINAV